MVLLYSSIFKEIYDYVNDTVLEIKTVASLRTVLSHTYTHLHNHIQAHIHTH